MVACLPTVSLEGKQCALPDHPCPEGLSCNPYTLTCGRELGCSWDVSPAEVCSVQGEDYYLSPDGSDARPGTDRALPARSFGLLRPLPGDRIHLLSGRYAERFDAAWAGSTACPISLSGETDGQRSFPDDLLAVLELPLVVAASHWIVGDIGFEVRTDNNAVLVAGAEGVAVERVRVARTGESAPAPTTYAGDVVLLGCPGCRVTASSFETGPGKGALFATSTSPGAFFLGNTVRCLDCGFAVKVNAAGALVAGNDISGTVRGVAIDFGDLFEGGGRLERNVLHDLSGLDVLGVWSRNPTIDVVSNTFASIGGTSLASGVAVFENNLVSHVENAVPLPRPTEGGFNLFDAVRMPYEDSTPEAPVGRTDVIGPARLGAGFVPEADSPAVDAADPVLPVPGGGGNRADIGALERGATRLPDGRYCLP